ncbi:hypothetical protein EV175_004345, partial [Coemansia sp. RSA 1933]
MDEALQSESLEKSSGGEEYIMKALAVGIQLDEQGSKGSGVAIEGRPRRQSLSQRLGLQTLGKKGKETEESVEYVSGGEQSTDDSRKASSLPAEHNIGGKQQQQQQRGAKVECVEVVGEDVYVGTSGGHIVHYTVAAAEVETETVPERFCVGSVDLGLGAKKVEQMLAFPLLNKLVVLCGSTVVILSLPDLRPASGMAAIKGVSCVGFDERIGRASSSSASVLCVGRMRSVQIYRLLATELRLEQEVAMGSSVASISQYGNYVCLADHETYKILDLARLRASPTDGAGQLELLPTQQPETDAMGRTVRPPRPRTLVVGPNEFMFLTASGDRDTLGVIVTALGEARRGTLQFAAYPRSITYDDPYIITVSQGGQVEIFDTRKQDQALVQTIGGAVRPRRICTVAGFDIGTRVAQPEVLDDRGAAPIDAAQVFGPPISPEAAASQRKQPLGRFGTARMVVVTQDAGVYALAHRPLLAVVDRLLAAHRVEDAMALADRALTSEPAALSDEAAYCFQMAGCLCLRSMLADDALHYFRRGSLDPRILLHLLPDIAERLGPQILAPLGRIPMAAGLRRLLAKIGDLRRLVRVSAEQLAGDDHAQTAALRRTLTVTALEMAQRYMEHCRKHLRDSSNRNCIDTALAILYVANGADRRLRNLIAAKDNAIVHDTAGRFLLDTHNRYYCSLLLKSQGHITRVLDIWHPLLLHGYTDRHFGGPDEYAAFVREIGDQPTLLSEYYWLADHKILATSISVLDRLDASTVTSMDAERAVRCSETDAHALRTLIERLVVCAHPRATHYMTHLAKADVRELIDLYDAAAVRSERNAFACAQADDLDLTLRAFLRRTSNGSGERVRLIDTLCASPTPAFDAQEVLAFIEKEAPDLLALERAILLVMVGRSADAAALLVEQVGDYAEAELLLLTPNNPASLARFSPTQTAPPDSGVQSLLSMYLALGQRGHDEIASRLVARLLDRYSLETGPALADIPDHWPYAIVEPFVLRSMQQAMRSLRRSHMVRGLHESRAFTAKVDLTACTTDAGAILLDYSQTCAKCKKLLGSSAFVFEPDTEQ